MTQSKDNSGALFANSNKEKDAQPDMTGVATINGVDYRVAGWKNTSQTGQDYVGLKFQLKDEKGETPSGEEPVSDNLPF